MASSIAWMVLPHHKKDVKPLPDEKALTDHLRALNLAPGTYMWPCCGSGEDMNSAEFKARYQAGPWGSINILPARPSFGRNLLLAFLLYLVVSVFVAYITSHARELGAPFISVFQVAGAVAVIAYCAGSIPDAIFFGRPARFVLTGFLDDLAYGILTGLTVAWLWPAAAAVS
ncbi:MAG: hypothetical protein JSU63_19565 [Phycisphaerales bacterium]|nr:MAG: hypothetical protein JSU63_19565 [Phycisphaerales bacterium]